MKAIYHLSIHAKTRLQQRGIRPETVWLILEHGANWNMKGGVRGHCFTQKKLNQARCYLTRKELQLIEKQRSAFIVTNGQNTVITAYHRTKRLWN